MPSPVKLVSPGTGPLAAPDAARALTSLRFFAAFYVLLFHAVPVLLAPENTAPWFLQWVSFGYVSVSFFFLLSGYILTLAYCGVRPKLQTKFPFYRARFARIYPLFVLTLLLDTPDWFAAHAREFGGYAHAVLPTAGVFLDHLFMLQAWTPWIRGIDRPNWSLSVETFFYLLFPFAAIQISRMRASSIAIFAGALWIGGQALIAIFVRGVSLDTIMFLPIFHLSTFLLGILLARWQISREMRLESIRGLIPAALVVAALASFAVWARPNPLARPFLNDGILAPVFALMIVAVSLNGRLPARILGHRAFQLLGDSSYGLYLFHFPILHYFQRLHLQPGWPAFSVYALTCITVSVLSFKYFESPCRSRLAHRADPIVPLKAEPA